MTDGDVATAYSLVKQIEDAVRGEAGETHASSCVFRQAVALRRALGEWIVVRATAAQTATATR